MSYKMTRGKFAAGIADASVSHVVTWQSVPVAAGPRRRSAVPLEHFHEGPVRHLVQLQESGQVPDEGVEVRVVCHKMAAPVLARHPLQRRHKLRQLSNKLSSICGTDTTTCTQRSQRV